MGVFTYDNSLTLELDDRTLAHVQAVMWAKVRRGEAFPFSWHDPDDEYQAVSVWISPHASLSYRYEKSDRFAMNHEWLQVLTKAANSAGGLRLVEEPASKENG